MPALRHARPVRFLATIGKAPTTTALNPTGADTQQGSVSLTATVTPTPVTVNGTTYPSNGTPPAGVITFTSGTTTLGTVALVPGFTPSGHAMATASITVGAGHSSVTATYTPAIGSNYTASSGSTSLTSTIGLLGEGTSTTSFTITDANGISSPGPYPASDSLTLNIQVNTPGNTPNGECFLFVFCSNTPTVSVYANGILLSNGVLLDTNGVGSFTVPRRNGYLNLASGQVQFNVIYSGYEYQYGLSWYEVDASSLVQTVTISDDRTNADFSLQTDTTVNQATPARLSGDAGHLQPATHLAL